MNIECLIMCIDELEKQESMSIMQLSGQSLCMLNILGHYCEFAIVRLTVALTFCELHDQ